MTDQNKLDDPVLARITTWCAAAIIIALTVAVVALIVVAVSWLARQM